MQKLFFLFITLMIAVLSACSHVVVNQSSNTVIQSPNDKRQYEYLVLPNEMKVLLVSDPDADKAAAALTVGVGSASNPPGRDGLAHFLEHMLFLGTEKYPDSDDYSQFINSNGGSQNAFTADNITTYFFDIKQEALQPALDRFSQFFIAPLFSRDFVDREKNAVHSEYVLKIKDDYRRVNAAKKQVYNKNSVYSRFAVGNLDTLSDRKESTSRDDVIAFYESHYSSNIMSLVVLGKEPLSQLKDWVLSSFSAVANKNLNQYTAEVKRFDDSSLPVRMNIESLQEVYELTLEFPLDNVISAYKIQPLYFMSHIIGHEGEGSLLSFLKDKGWATGLIADYGDYDYSESALRNSIQLTEEGFTHIDEIVEYYFDYIELIQQAGSERFRYDELQSMGELDFRFSEKSKASTLVTNLSGSMQYYPAEDLLRSHIPQQYDDELIATLLSQINPENMLMTVIGKDVETNQTEELYQVDYMISEINPELIRQWNKSGASPGLALPEPNPYIPDSASIKGLAAAQNVPDRINANEGFDVWHQQDNSFGIPKARLLVSLKSPVANDTAKHSVMKQILVSLINEQLNKIVYPASMAGLSAGLDNNDWGMNINISGYDQKQPLILKEVINHLKAPTIEAEKFSIYKDKLLLEIKNLKFSKPFRQLISARNRHMVNPSWSPEERIEALENVTLEELEQYQSKILDSVEVKILSYGNVTVDEAKQLTTLIKDNLLDNSQLDEIMDPELTVLSRDEPASVSFKVDHPDAVVVTSYQGLDESIDQQAKWRLLAQIISTPFFSDLRTRQQLGYVVHAGYAEDEKVPGLLLLVQSPVVDVNELEKRIDRFTDDFIDQLQEMSDSDFSTHKKGMIAKLLKKDQKMHDVIIRYVRNIYKENYSFDLNQKLAEAVRGLDKQSLVEFYRHSVLEKPAKLVFLNPGNKVAGQPPG